MTGHAVARIARKECHGAFEFVRLSHSPHGINFIDTARVHDESEAIVGRALTDRYTHLPPELGELEKSVQQLGELSSNEVGSLPELAYRFVLGHPAVVSALVGTGRISELDEVLSLIRRGNLSLKLKMRYGKSKPIPINSIQVIGPYIRFQQMKNVSK